jgi:hypothetical protein
MSARPALPPDLERLVHRELDGLLSPAEALELDRASAAEPAVARERAAWAEIRATLRGAAAETAPRSGLAASSAEAARRQPGTLITATPWRRASAVAAAVLMMAAIFGLGRASVRESEVIAEPRQVQRTEADQRAAWLKIGLKPGEVDELERIGRQFEARRSDLFKSMQPDLDAFDQAEREQKWGALCQESQDLYRKSDPHVMPKDTPKDAGGK